MTRDEFDDWLEYHCGAFRSISKWLGSLGTEEAEKTLGHWFRVLRNIGLDEAKQATERLFAGQEAEPKSRDKIPAAIRAISKKLRSGGSSRRERRSVYVDGEPVFECNLCEDDGRIVLLEFEGEEDAFPGAPYRATYACRCRHGDLWVKQGLVRAPSGAKPPSLAKWSEANNQWRVQWQAARAADKESQANQETAIAARHAGPHCGSPAQLAAKIGAMPEN